MAKPKNQTSAKKQSSKEPEKTSAEDKTSQNKIDNAAKKSTLSKMFSKIGPRSEKSAKTDGDDTPQNETDKATRNKADKASKKSPISKLISTINPLSKKSAKTGAKGETPRNKPDNATLNAADSVPQNNADNALQALPEEIRQKPTYADLFANGSNPMADFKPPWDKTENAPQNTAEKMPSEPNPEYAHLFVNGFNPMADLGAPWGMSGNAPQSTVETNPGYADLFVNGSNPMADFIKAPSEKSGHAPPSAVEKMPPEPNPDYADLFVNGSNPMANGFVHDQKLSELNEIAERAREVQRGVEQSDRRVSGEQSPIREHGKSVPSAPPLEPELAALPLKPDGVSGKQSPIRDNGGYVPSAPPLEPDLAAVSLKPDGVSGEQSPIREHGKNVPSAPPLEPELARLPLQPEPQQRTVGGEGPESLPQQPWRRLPVAPSQGVRTKLAHLNSKDGNSTRLAEIKNANQPPKNPSNTQAPGTRTLQSKTPPLKQQNGAHKF